ncbi:hypothetical protein P4S72_04540 [Vibrio sp. PP-XX7]
MRKILTRLSIVVLLTYPFAIYFGIDKFGLKLVGGLLIAVFLLRIYTSGQILSREFRQIAWVSSVTGGLIVLSSLLFKQQGWLQFYPVIVNVYMLCLFAFSLKHPQTIIEKIARIQTLRPSPEGVTYTRKVTLAWCAFFLFNAIVALYTCFQSMAIWTLYNGLISYILIGCLFIGEWIIRQRVQRNSQ